MHFTKFTTNSRIKIGRGDFLHRGQIDPRSLTSGPQVHVHGHAGQSNLAPGQAMPARLGSARRLKALAVGREGRGTD
jgi:hypothetical protein